MPTRLTRTDAETPSPRVPWTEEPAEVRLGFSAPKEAHPGDRCLVTFFASTVDLHEEVERKVRALDPSAIAHPDLARCRWRRGLKVTVRLSGENIEVDKPIQEFDWNGAFHIVPFDVTIARDAAAPMTILALDVLLDGVVVAPVKFTLRIRPPEVEPSAETHTGWINPARTAFASYASEDRSRVLDRVAVLVEGGGMEVFVDCLSLRPGDRWKPQIEEQIRDMELFLLYWSKGASRSEWVEWEWRKALHLKGKEHFKLRPLDPIKLTEFPEELEALHAESSIMLIRFGDEALRERERETP